MHAFALLTVLAHDRHVPAVHAEQPDDPAVELKYPTGHAKPTPVIAAAVTAPVPLTVPVQEPAVHGLGERDKIVAPAESVPPVITMPTETEPDVTDEIVRLPDVTVPATTPVAVPTGQKAPAGHCAVHALDESPLAAP